VQRQETHNSPEGTAAERRHSRPCKHDLLTADLIHIALRGDIAVTRRRFGLVQSVLFTGRTRHTILGDFSCPHRHGSPQPCSILCVSWSGLIFIRRSVIAKFVAPDSSLVAWLGRGAFSGTLPHHLHRIGNRNGGIEGWPAVRPRHVEHNPGIGLISGVPSQSSQSS